MNKIKPILFNTDMVRGLLNGTKTVTRRVVKPKYSNTHLEMRTDKCGTRLIEIENEIPGVTRVKNPDGTITLKIRAFIERTPPYRIGDILYVRETWVRSMAGTYLYRATDTPLILDGWCPSIHMPREAARIFLRVTDIKVQRVQDITDEEAQKEGVKGWMVATDRDWDKNPNFVIAFRHVWNNCYSKPQSVKTKGVITHYESYPWEDIQETRTYRGKPWYVIGNPWVWIIEFERCEKPEGG